jgi:hypothetical protein
MAISATPSASSLSGVQIYAGSGKPRFAWSGDEAARGRALRGTLVANAFIESEVERLARAAARLRCWYTYFCVQESRA